MEGNGNNNFYILSDDKTGSKYSEHMKNRYERRLVELSEEYEKEYNKLIQKQDKEIMTIEYFLKNIISQNQANNNKDRIKEIKEEHKKQIVKLKADYEAKRKKIIRAYKHFATIGLRDIYEENKGYSSNRPYLNGDTAYDFFAISEEEIYTLNADKADSIIKDVYDKFVKCYKDVLSNPELDEIIKREIENDYALACSYYNKISNMESRIAYKDELDIKEKEKKREALDDYIRDKCSKADQFDPELIETRNSNENAPLKSVRYKKSIDPVKIILIDKKNRNTLLTKTGEIVFRTTPNNIESYISEYEVSKIINGKEKVYKIYANLNLQQLGRDKETGNLINPEYYDCVVNDLLSEGVLRGSKYNKGYVGGVEKDENGHYQIILKNKELDSNEKENLAAVMIYAEQQNNQKANKEQESDEGR